MSVNHGNCIFFYCFKIAALSKIVTELNAALSQVANQTNSNATTLPPSVVYPASLEIKHKKNFYSEESVVVPSLYVERLQSTAAVAAATTRRFNSFVSNTIMPEHFAFFDPMSTQSSSVTPQFVLVESAPTMNGSNETFDGLSINDFFSTLIPQELGLFEIVVHILLLVMCFLIGGVTVFLNAVVIRCFAKESSVRSPSNFFILSLASTDCLIGLISLPVYTMYLILEERWPFGATFCDIWLVVDYTLCLVSQYTVFAITVDRFFSVKYPALYRAWLTKKKSAIIIASIWLLSLSIFGVLIIGWQYFVGKRTVPADKCHVQFISSAFFNMIFVIGYYWSTLIVIVVLYAQIVYAVYKRSKRLQRKADATLNALCSRSGSNTNGSNVQFDDCDLEDESHSDHEQINLENSGFFASLTNYANFVKHSGGKMHRFKGKLMKTSWESSNGTVKTMTTDTLEESIRTHENDETMTPAKRMSTLSPQTASSSQGTGELDEDIDLTGSENAPSLARPESATVDTPSMMSPQSSKPSNGHSSSLCNTIVNCRRNREKQANKTFLVVSLILGVFVFTWSPYHILAIVKGFCDDCVPKSLYNLTYWFCYLNSPINPICKLKPFLYIL